MNKKAQEDIGAAAIAIIILIILLVAIVGSFMWIGPKYRIYKQDLRGQAELREAEWTKEILVETATAERDAAIMQAQSEVERAKGVAEANKIIGNSLKGNDDYLRYLWVQGLNDGNSEVIYIPTEANLPILEARNK